MNSQRRTNLNELGNSSKRFRLFIDDGGVLNDNSLRGPEWLRLIGEFMPARMTGTAEQWANANRMVFPKVWAGVQERLPDFANYEEFQRSYATNWMGSMCARLGITPVPDDEAVTLCRQLSVYVAERERSAVPGAADAVLALSRAGYTMYTASGTPSWELRAITVRMGISGAISRCLDPTSLIT